jgi:hypothetical protein
MNAVTHLEKVITGEVSAVTHLEKVIAGETSAVTYTEKVITGEAPPITHLQRVIAGVESPVTHLEYVWAGGSPTPTEHEYTGVVPYTFTANGSPLMAWRISGNTVRSTTPTHDNPIMPQGCGELETSGVHSGQYKIPISCGGTTNNVYLGEVQTTRQIKKYEFTGQEDWSISNNERVLYTALADHLTSNELICYCSHYKSIANISAISTLSNGECAFNNTLRWFYIKDDNYNDASTFKTYLAQQYAAGTPVIVWYILATPQTATVNEPLMKIGDYADEVSNAATIPTVNGSNTFDVDTTVKPSEVYIKYKGV